MSSTETVRECGCAGKGRHRDTCPTKSSDQTMSVAETPIAVGVMWCGLPCMPDAEMENYGGDLAAHESYSPHARRPMATVHSAQSTAQAQPDLNYKGMLVFRHDPAQLFHFAYLDEDGSNHYRITVQSLRQRGYRPVTVADFYVHSLLRGVFIPEDGTANGRLTLGGALKGGTTVIYCQDELNYKKWRAHERRITDSILQTAAQGASNLGEQLARDGFADVSVTSSWEGV